jgi:hypothetical protein
MAEEPKTNKAVQTSQRQARLAAELRANLKKRKQQARERAEAGAPSTGHAEEANEERS